MKELPIWRADSWVVKSACHICIRPWFESQPEDLCCMLHSSSLPFPINPLSYKRACAWKQKRIANFPLVYMHLKTSTYMGQIVNIHRVGSCDFWKLYNSQLKAGSHLNIKYHNSATEKCALTWAAAIIYEQVRLDKLHESALQVHDTNILFFSSYWLRILLCLRLQTASLTDIQSHTTWVHWFDLISLLFCILHFVIGLWSSSM